MFRLLFYAVLLILLARALRSLWRGILEGLNQPANARGNAAIPGVHMVRDPVCGTFVVPDRAVSLTVGRDHVYFCSVACRDKYRSHPGSRTGRVAGRTA